MDQCAGRIISPLSCDPHHTQHTYTTTNKTQIIRDLFLLGAGAAFYPFIAHPQHRPQVSAYTLCVYKYIKRHTYT